MLLNSKHISGAGDLHITRWPKTHAILATMRLFFLSVRLAPGERSVSRTLFHWVCERKDVQALMGFVIAVFVSLLEF